MSITLFTCLLFICVPVHHQCTLPFQGYGDVFIQKVKQKHTLARNYFSRLPGMAELMRQHGSEKANMAPGPSTIAGHSFPMQPQKV